MKRLRKSGLIGGLALALLLPQAAPAQTVGGGQPSAPSAGPIAGKNFGYRVTDPSPAFGPTSVYDDGVQTYFQLRKEATPTVQKPNAPDVAIPVSRDGLLLTVSGVADEFELKWSDATTRVTRTVVPVVPAVAKAPVATPVAVDAPTPQVTQLRIDERSDWVRFDARADESLSKALRASIANSMWQDIVWDVREDFVIRHPFQVLASDFPELFRKVLAPFNLDARFHRGNHLIHIFPSQGEAQ